MKNMKTAPIIDIVNPPPAVPATVDQLAALGVTPAEIEAGEKRFRSAHFGHWRITVSVSAIVEETEFAENPCPYSTKIDRSRFYPVRKAGKCREDGYCMRGVISLNGKKRRVFTSSQLFELPDGRLVNVAVLHTSK